MKAILHRRCYCFKACLVTTITADQLIKIKEYLVIKYCGRSVHDGTTFEVALFAVELQV